MILDIEKYLPELDGYDLTREQKETMLRCVWNIMEACANRAFHKHPVQQARQEIQHSSDNRRLHLCSRSIDSKGRGISSRFKHSASEDA